MYEKITPPPGWDSWRWDVPRHAAGQIVEISYSDGPQTGRYEVGHGARYQRVHDKSDKTDAFYRWVK